MATQHKTLPATLQAPTSLEVHPGDVLMSRASGSPELVGSVAYVERCRRRLLLSDKIFRLRQDSLIIDAQFLALALNALPVRAQIESALSGGRGLAANIPQSIVRNLVIAVPPRPEQEPLLTQLSSKTAQFDALLTRTRVGIERLKELRTALIAAAVTGKIDVRASIATEGSSGDPA